MEAHRNGAELLLRQQVHDGAAHASPIDDQATGHVGRQPRQQARDVFNDARVGGPQLPPPGRAYHIFSGQIPLGPLLIHLLHLLHLLRPLKDDERAIILALP